MPRLLPAAPVQSGDPGLIDLHLHTTASDGRLSPEQLVAAAAAAGLTTIAVTDHDTVEATAVVARLCCERGIEAAPGIEMSAVANGRDVHVLGYFVDPAAPTFLAFLKKQRIQRVARVEAIAARLETLGMPVDVAPIAERARAGSSVGRPHIARALVDAGYAANTREAFERWLGEGLPAFVPRTGVSPADAFHVIHAAGGLASLAHPGRTAIDAQIPQLRDQGLDALEAYHSDHSPEEVDTYLRMAFDLGILVTGGSDYHADPAREVSLGAVSLPAPHWERLVAHRAKAS